MEKLDLAETATVRIAERICFTVERRSSGIVVCIDGWKFTLKGAASKIPNVMVGPAFMNSGAA